MSAVVRRRHGKGERPRTAKHDARRAMQRAPRPYDSARARMTDTAAVSVQYTQTRVFFGSTSCVHSQSIAGSVTRTHPCDAGYGGTLVYP